LASEIIPQPAATTGLGRFVEQYGSTVIVQGLTLGLGILTGILSARMLGPAGRGEYAAIVIWPTGIASFLALGINQAVVYHLGQRTLNGSEMATATATIGLIQSFLSVVIGLIVIPTVLARYSLQVRQLGILFVLCTPALIFSMYPANLFQGGQDLLKFNVIRVAAPFSYAIGLVALYVAHRGSLVRVIQSQLAGYLFALGLGFFLVWRFLRPRMQWNGSAIPHLFHYGCRIQGLSIATYFNQRVDQLVLSLLVPPRELGLYAIAVTLSITVAVFPQAAGIVAFSRGASQQGEHAKATIGVAFRSSLAWLAAACGGLYLLAPFLIHFVFGGAFDGSILACRILLPGAFVTGLNFVLYNAASALGRPILASYAESASVLVTAGGLYLLVPHYGYIGAAIVSSVAYTVSFLVMLILAHRLLGLNLRVLLFGGLRPAQPGNTRSIS